MFGLLGRWGMDAVYHGFLAVNNLLSVVGAMAAYGVARHAGKRAGWGIALLVLLWPSLAVYQVTVMSENLFIPLYLVSLWLLWQMQITDRSSTTNRYIALGFGAVLALLYETRNIGGILILPAAFGTLLWARRWREAALTALGLALALAVLSLPGYVWGSCRLYQYTNQQSQMARALKGVMSDWDQSKMFLVSTGYSLLYAFLGTLVIPMIAAVYRWRSMPRSWRVVWMYVLLGFLFMLPASVLLTCTEIPGQVNLITRYFDPFIVGWVLLGLVAMASAHEKDALWPYVVSFVVLGVVVVPNLQVVFWMQVLALNYLRWAKLQQPDISLLVWFALSGMILIVFRLWQNRKQWAIYVAASILCAINYCNAFQYRESGVHLRRMIQIAEPMIARQSSVDISQLARVFKGSKVELMLGGMVYFWTLDRPDVVVQFAEGPKNTGDSP